MGSVAGYTVGREDGLTKRDRDVIDLHFIQKKSQSDVGRALGISRQAVSQIVTRLKKDPVRLQAVIDKTGEDPNAPKPGREEEDVDSATDEKVTA